MNDPYRKRTRIGVVVPVSNTNLEPDLYQFAPKNLSFHFVRTGGYDVDQIPDEHQMRQYSDHDSSDDVEALRHCRPELILYGCTSATLSQGPDYDQQFCQRISDTVGVPAVTAASALVEVLAALEIRYFSFTSPYVASLNNLSIEFLQHQGCRCVSRVDAPEAMSNEAVGDALPDDIFNRAIMADHVDAEALVVSCTDYRATEAAVHIEEKTGKPVITSNLALLLVAMKKLNISAKDSPLRHLMTAQRFLAGV